MTERQKKFCDEYLVDCNASRAAVRAGYSERNARQIGQRLLTNVDIKEYIDEQLAAIHSEKSADAKEVIEYLTAVMRGQSESEVVVVEQMGDYTSEARVMKKHPDEKERLKAAELLGKRHGLFTDKVDVDGGAKIIFMGEGELSE